jgi:transposase InsO family protein
MSYQLIEDLQQKAVTVSQACRTLAVSRSGFYAAAKRRSPAPVVCAASVYLKAAFAASGRTYGSRRLRAALHMSGVTMGRHKVRRLMRLNGMRHSVKKLHNLRAKNYSIQGLGPILFRYVKPGSVHASGEACNRVGAR